MGILNYTPQPHTVLYGEDAKYYTGSGFLGIGLGVMVKLPSSTYARYLTRITLNCAIISDDTWPFPWPWDGQGTTAPFFLTFGTPANSDFLDYTMLGDKNVSEYATPLLVPANAELFGTWPSVFATKARSCICVMDLAT